MTGFRLDGPEDAPATLLLAHGAGAAMDSPAMQAIALALAAAGLRVARFEFGYMAGRREGRRAAPPRAETLTAEYRAAVAALPPAGRLVIGGKSMGGRVASMVADAVAPAGLLCLGYPFHPPGRPEQLRTAHLATLRTRTLICQGSRDPFGTAEEVATYSLAPAIEIAWIEDGDHDLRPRKSVTGRTAAEARTALAARVAAWTRTL
ncbi:MAG TPA: alpha/beta family hydrolase [Amaricoccus sp.]|jgi:predicted alpha/beta-hydrolase family hydrolase|nr:alpha/beta family hydrolase [Amaricoccus sp.]